MIFSADDVHGYDLRATDDTLGGIHDFLFDDDSWVVRYLVADTRLIFGRRVLLVPDVLGHPDSARGEIPVDLTKQQIKDSPELDTDKPVSRQQESTLFGYYGWTPYWTTPELGGFPTTPLVSPEAADPTATATVAEADANPRLRSMREVSGYTVEASDGSIGSVDDFLIDDDAWQIRYLVVDTGKWLPGRKVLVAPQWANSIDWGKASLFTELTRDQVRDAPEYRPDSAIDRDYEKRLFSYFGYGPYW